MDNIIDISKTAAAQFKEIIKAAQEQNPEDSLFVRCYVVSGGCSGMKYGMVIDSEITDKKDQVCFENEELKVISDLNSLPYVNGLEIDYSDDLIKGGFMMQNPNMKGGCGCGSSFTPSDDEEEQPEQTTGCGSCTNG